MTEATGPRFLTLDQVAEELATSHSQVYAMVRRGELRGIKLGGRGQWRIERAVLEQYIAEAYETTAAFIEANPFVESPSPKDRGEREGTFDA